LAFKDSSCADSDANFSIVVAATDTGSSTEDIDVSFLAQVAGNEITFLNFNADGAMTLGYNSQPVYVSKLQSRVPVTPVTTTASPTGPDSGTVYTNEGDDNGAGVTLPSAAAGYQFTFVVQANQVFTITAGAEDTIRIATSVTAAAGAISASAIGCAITLVAINATEWIATAVVGSWTI
jgi:hypothetical protein